MKTLLVFLVAVSLSSSALAQVPGRLAPAATTQAAAAAAAPSHPSRVARLVRDTLVGAGAGAVTGYLVWAVSRDCGTCGPGPQHSVTSTALFGATAGAWIGVVDGWGAGRHPDVRIGRHVSAAPAVSPSQAGGVVKLAF